jgi:Patatin-like phospholipase
VAQGITSTTAARREPLLVDLALQGSGAHGAFTWGVIDRLLEEPWLEFDGISGTSAGAMNAAVMVDGFAASGREGARVALEAFWRGVARAATFSPFRRTPLDPWTSTSCCGSSERWTSPASCSASACLRTACAKRGESGGALGASSRGTERVMHCPHRYASRQPRSAPR